MHNHISTLVSQSYELNAQQRHLECFELLQVPMRDPSSPVELRLNFVVALIGLNRLPQAEETLAPLLAEIDELSPQTQRAVVCNQAIVEQRTGRAGLAADRLELLCEAFPDDLVVHTNAGLALSSAGRLEAAEAKLKIALDLEPNNRKVMNAMANCLQAQGKWEEEIRLLRQIIAITPDDAQMHVNLSLSLLRARQFQEGWQEFEHRPQSWNLSWLQPDWPIGEALDHRTIAVIVDEGIGDAIMFSPMLEQAAAVASDHVIYCDARLISLLRRSWPDLHFESQVIDHRFETMQRRVRLGSLTNVFRRTEAAFPRHEGFLNADPNRILHWQKWLQQLGPGPWIGIGWAGGRHDVCSQNRRSIPLRLWQPLLKAVSAQWICLQHEPAQDELRAIQSMLGMPIHQIEGLTHNIDEMASLTSALSAVISCEQTAVHVAGGVGTPCLALLSDPPGWRYIARDPSCPQKRMLWYDNVTLMEKQQWQQWHPIIEWLHRFA